MIQKKFNHYLGYADKAPVTIIRANIVKNAKLLVVVCCLSLCGGCATVDFIELLTPEKQPYYKEASAGYQQTMLKLSNTADVMSVISLPGHEQISQSKNVIASFGQKKKKNYKTWLKMAAFDEDSLTATRKYFLMVDERPKFLFVDPWEMFLFDCKMVLPSEILDEPYSNENARRIAILRSVQENTREDIGEVSPDNKKIAISGMIINQSLEAILVVLDDSPVLAAKLSDDKGLKFEHYSFNKAKIKMTIDGDIVEVKIRGGSVVKKRIGKPDKTFKNQDWSELEE